jgi:hypothetical protein
LTRSADIRNLCRENMARCHLSMPHGAIRRAARLNIAARSDQAGHRSLRAPIMRHWSRSSRAITSRRRGMVVGWRIDCRDEENRGFGRSDGTTTNSTKSPAKKRSPSPGSATGHFRSVSLCPVRTGIATIDYITRPERKSDTTPNRYVSPILIVVPLILAFGLFFLSLMGLSHHA